jgi:hypothetical protein
MRVYLPFVNLFSRVTPARRRRQSRRSQRLPPRRGADRLLLVEQSPQQPLPLRRGRARVPAGAVVRGRERGWGAARLAQMVRTNDMIFGYGRWSCLGKVVTLIEIHKVVFEFRSSDFAITNPQRAWESHNLLGCMRLGICGLRLRSGLSLLGGMVLTYLRLNP